MEGYPSRIIYVKPISSHMLGQDAPGFLQIHLMLTAVLYSLVESAKANELDVYEYLKYLLDEMSNMDFKYSSEILDQLLPWSTELPEECRLNHKHKKSLPK